MPHTMRNQALIQNAVKKIAPLWPLQNYIAVNPLNSFDEDFIKTLKDLSQMTGSDLFPSSSMIQQALERGDLSLNILQKAARKHGVESELDDILSCPEKSIDLSPQISDADLCMIKYLNSFFDNVQADWGAPSRDIGLYRWWKQAAAKDLKFADRSLPKSLPSDPTETVVSLLQEIPLDEWETQIELHFYNLKGWVSYIRWYEQSTMYEQCPADLLDFLAISLATHKAFKQPIKSSKEKQEKIDGKVWLEAWEESFRAQFIKKLQHNIPRSLPTHRPAAQFVFCIDVRSESVRRHIEQQGSYETFGFAGFFGIPLTTQDILGNEKDISPVLLDPLHQISLSPKNSKDKKGDYYIKKLKLASDVKHLYEGLKKDLVTSLGCVELTGLYYGLFSALKTSFPKITALKKYTNRKQSFSEISYETQKQFDGALTHDQQVNYAYNFLNAIGLKNGFARTFVITGHESETQNNHYASKLDCGACGANSGRISSQLMADILNKSKVRASLIKLSIRIPRDTVFYSAIHNTTTDEISFLSDVTDDETFQVLFAALKQTQRECRKEKNKLLPNYKHNHLDWSQAQPEWGLARNGGMIIGSRELTRSIDLESRCFLHSYDHTQDPSGDILTAILSAPMRVAQMINAQYYFSTIDNQFFGAGTKITHNIVGGFAAMQGNGSDLKIGLPLQAIQYSEGKIYHEPIRLQVFIHAPRNIIEGAIGRSAEVRSLCNNLWLRLVAIDPSDGNYYLYNSEKNWERIFLSDISQQNNPILNEPQHKAA